MDSVAAYLARLHQIRASGAGVPELSYYGALETLLTEIGRTLKPPVICIAQLTDVGAGVPDAGLFTAVAVQPRDGDAAKMERILLAQLEALAKEQVTDDEVAQAKKRIDNAYEM